MFPRNDVQCQDKRTVMPRVVRTRTSPMAPLGRTGKHAARPLAADDPPCGVPGVVRHMDEMIERYAGPRVPRRLVQRKTSLRLAALARTW